MNSHEYAKHRKAKDLSGGSHVAVLKQIEAGKISAAASKVDGHWQIDAAKADELWAASVDPSQGKPLGGNTGGRPRWSTLNASAKMEGARIEAQEAKPVGFMGDMAKVAQMLNAGRAAKAHVDAESAKLDLEEKRGTLVNLATINAYVSSIIIKARDELLRIAPELRDRIAQESDPIVIEQIIDERVRRALQGLSEYRP